MSRYTASHANPQGAGDARPTALQIIEDEGVQGKLASKVVVITGASSGIGIETARALSATGATLYLAVRDLNKARKSLAGILEADRVSLVEMDLTSFKSIRAGAKQILTATNGQVNILINSAGVMGVQQRTLSGDGIEVHFAANHLGFFLLFQLLKQSLLDSVTPDLHSRVVVVASSAHRAGAIPAGDNYSFEKGGFNHEAAYNNAKLAAVYLANRIDSIYGTQGLHATSVHPGAVDTDIGRNLPPEALEAIISNPYVLKILKSPEQGAATTVWAAVSKEWESKGGKYLEDCKEAGRGLDDGQVFGAGWVKQTYNAKEEARVWNDSLRLVGLETKV